jgi:murein L,D-transpeptidase YcbB/YkuD
LRLQPGASGHAVVRLQHRLAQLGYWVGNPDGRFGSLTQQAVLAFQKVARLEPDGVVGRRTIRALDYGVVPRVRTGMVDGVQIDLERQVLVVVRDGAALWTFNTSTGSGASYWQDGQQHVAVTPRGHFTVFREVDGADVSPLGVLWRPKYFIGGIAIHGYSDVPAEPASHGCVRLTTAAMDFLWSADLLPLGSPVWTY